MKEPTPTFNTLDRRSSVKQGETTMLLKKIRIRFRGPIIIQCSVLFGQCFLSPPTGQAWKSLPSLPNPSSRFLAVTLALLLLLLKSTLKTWRSDSKGKGKSWKNGIPNKNYPSRRGRRVRKEHSIICLTRSLVWNPYNFQWLHNHLHFPISLHFRRTSHLPHLPQLPEHASQSES